MIAARRFTFSKKSNGEIHGSVTVIPVDELDACDWEETEKAVRTSVHVLLGIRMPAYVLDRIKEFCQGETVFSDMDDECFTGSEF